MAPSVSSRRAIVLRKRRFHVGRDRTEKRRLRLVRPVGPAEPLDRRVCLPARLEQEVDAARLVSSGKIGMVTSSCSSGVGKDQDALGAVHERLGLGHIGARRPGLQFLTTIATDDEPARATGYLRYLVNAEAFDDRIKCGGDRWQGA